MLLIFTLQQRLEQLVVVHRQLLRRFAQQELENADYRKKLTLRDKHIAHLEGNATTLTAAMRGQAVSTNDCWKSHLKCLLLGHTPCMRFHRNCSCPFGPA